MPRFFFHIEDGQSLPDTIGTELPDLSSAKHEAMKLLGAVLQDTFEQFWKHDDWRMRVTDAQGLVLFVLSVSASDAPAIVHGLH